MNYFRGDTLKFDYFIEINDEKYKFKKDDELLIIIYNKTDKDNDFITKEIKLIESETDVNIYFDANKMKQIKGKDCLLEIKLINKNDIITTLQENIFIKESWCKNEYINK